MKNLTAICALATATTVSHAETITTTTTSTTTITIDVEPPPLLAPPGLAPPIEVPTERPVAAERTFRLAIATGPALGFDTKDKCGEGECIAAHVQVGVAVARHALLMLGSSMMLSPADPDEDRHHVETLALQYWPTARAWCEVGVGFGSKRSWDYPKPPPMSLAGVDLAGTLAVGFEAIVRRGYSIGIQARVAGTSDVEHTSFGEVLLGVSWY